MVTPASLLTVVKVARQPGYERVVFEFDKLAPAYDVRYVDRVRLETARRLLEDTAAGIAEVARCSGYGTPEAMRRAFVRALGISPSDYRHHRPEARCADRRPAL